MEKVTIVTATSDLLNNNRKECFEQMVKSIQAQTYKNIEHLIMDGASSDGTLELIDLLIDNKNNTTLVISEPDNGIYNAFNKGINKSTGDYILFMNSDDYFYTETAIEKLVAAIRHDKSEFAFSNAYIDKNGNGSYFIRDIPDPLLYTIVNPCNHQTLIAKRELYEKYGAFDEQYAIAADIKFKIQLFNNQHSYSYVNEYLVISSPGGVSYTNGDLSCKEVACILKDEIFIDKSIGIDLIEQLYRNQKFSYKSLMLILNGNLNVPQIVFNKLRKRLLLRYTKHIYNNIMYYVRLRFVVKHLENFIRSFKKRRRP